jgi:predicted anti-sigma-YlaC factor YlaD
MHRDCDRARQWASTELDGELSTFEHVLLRAHLVGCSSCKDFRASIAGTTRALRAAPLEQLESPVEIRRIRRRPRLRLAPAAAAVAVAAVGLGSFLASAQVRSSSVNATRVAPSPVAGKLVSLDTMNLRTSSMLERMNAFQQLRAAPTQRPVSGGQVIHEP